MKKHALPDRCTALLLAASLLLSLAACGNQAKATTMHLKRTEGTVAVSDDAGEDVPLLEDLGLYSGYGVGTRPASFAWINLDDVKLTKMDEASEIAIQKEDKLLEIEVKSGSLFFNVTQPLEEDETMNIRTSTMLVGIRGTCGWVTEDTAALLEGTVSVTAGDQSVTVTAGEMAVLTAEETLEVKPLTAAQVPVFVKAELEEDDALAEAVLDGSDVDPLAPVDPMRLRDMYTYSKSLNYNANGDLTVEQTFFPDELGRIGKMVVQDGSETVCEYIYNDAGTLSQTVRSDGTVLRIVTEDTADHRKMTSPDHPNREYVYYYDEQGRTVRAEYFGENNHNAYYTYLYDTEGKLVRVDNYYEGDPPDSPSYYTLYEYD